MKTVKLFLVLTLISLISWSTKEPVGYDKKQALENFNVCKKLADKWLKALDSTDYSHLYSIELPDGKYDEKYDEMVVAYINEKRREYGRVTGRTLLGSHIYFHSEQITLTYIPEIQEKYLAHINATMSEDGFYIVEPKYFGLTSYKQMFSGLPEGDYVILMYKVTTTNKPYAEEQLTFIKAKNNNPDGVWKVAGYKLADEI